MFEVVIKKGKRKFLRLIFSRLGVITLLFLLQLSLLCVLFFRLENYMPHFFGSNIAVSAVAVIYLINSSMNPNAKITWLALIMLFPVFGSLMLGYTKSEIGHRALKKRFAKLTEQNRGMISQDIRVMSALKNTDVRIAKLAEYIARSGTHPIFGNSKVVYFSSGEEKLAELLLQLERAEKFIFLEYFIISEGFMWTQLMNVLKRKASEGVEIRIIYDGTCEFTNLPHDYPKILKSYGIECKMFAPITPFVSTHYNYRDHRKIAIIDGRVAFNGGINLADEYINKEERFGHWKDTAVMVEGDAVKSFTLMFLQMWEMNCKCEDNSKYLIEHEADSVSGYVLPFGDCPVDDDKVGERVYMDILNRATQYVHIMTPYLILDSEMETALKFAAERGVDVSIILPGIPDKKSAWALAKTHYRSLIDSGVKIYEYIPGFVHAKSFVSDDREAVVGTVNLDYRSLYHHFECATYFAYNAAVEDVEKDFLYTLDKCRRVTYESIKKEKITIKIRGAILKIIAPLM